jgi:hypothetical protein
MGERRKRERERESENTLRRLGPSVFLSFPREYSPVPSLRERERDRQRERSNERRIRN